MHVRVNVGRAGVTIDRMGRASAKELDGWRAVMSLGWYVFLEDGVLGGMSDIAFQDTDQPDPHILQYCLFCGCETFVRISMCRDFG